MNHALRVPGGVTSKNFDLSESFTQSDVKNAPFSAHSVNTHISVRTAGEQSKAIVGHSERFLKSRFGELTRAIQAISGKMSAMPIFRVITSAKENEHEVYEIEADSYRLPEAGGFVVFESQGKTVAHFLTTQLIGIVDKDSQER